jgi:hypothetical protein
VTGKEALARGGSKTADLLAAELLEDLEADYPPEASVEAVLVAAVVEEDDGWFVSWRVHPDRGQVPLGAHRLVTGCYKSGEGAKA